MVNSSWNMAATMYRPRSIRRSKGRHDSGDVDVPLDLNRAPEDNVRDILVTLVQDKSPSKGKKLGHLNNFVKLVNSITSTKDLCFPAPEILCCLRLSLTHSTKEVRGAGLRAIRYFIQDETSCQALLGLHLDLLVMHSLDLCENNDIERIQAVRLIRRIITVCPALCPLSLIHSLTAIGNNGDSQRDSLKRACVATLCELAIHNTEAFSKAGGLSTLIRNILDTQLLRINESVTLTVLHLLNHPSTRRFIRFKADIEQVIAPYTDIHYRHSGEADQQNSGTEDRESWYRASRIAVVTLLRSWPGMIRLCSAESSGLQSLMQILCVPQEENRRYLLEVLYEAFYLTIPKWTDDFDIAIESIDTHDSQLCTLGEGFVVEEALTVLPHRAITRTNLKENHLALLLLAFINAGLLESLVEVITSGTEHLSIMGTVFLGELLHMCDRMLPVECELHHHTLPTLMALAASLDASILQRIRATQAVTNLCRFHELKKRGPIPCSLFLDQILCNSPGYMGQRNEKINSNKPMPLTDMDESNVQAALKDTLVLSGKEFKEWKWDLIGSLIKRGGPSLHKFDDANINRFFRKLMDFYKPMSRGFSSVDIGKDGSRSPEAENYTLIGRQLIDYLLKSTDAEAERLLCELSEDIADCLLEISMAPLNSVAPEAIFSTVSVQNSLCQDYFIFVGRLSQTHRGEKILERAHAFQYMLDVCSSKVHMTLQKLIVTCLDYSREGLGRTVLSKVLTATSEPMRLYTTSHMRVLLRAQVPYFQHWGVENLVCQLYDKDKQVSTEALAVLDEACEDEINLHSLVQIRPSLLHLGDHGALLLTRFLSTPKGFRYLSEVNFVQNELDKWYSTLNRKYVILVETEINEAFTSHKRQSAEGFLLRRSQNDSKRKKDVFVPVHLYGQLVQHKIGAELLEKQNVIPELCSRVHLADISSSERLMELKSALWCLGHMGSSPLGLKLLEKMNIIPEIIRLAEECEVFSIRGTCFFVIGLLSKTKAGADILSSLGWESVRRTRNEFFPIANDSSSIFDHLGRFIDHPPPISTLPSVSSFIMEQPSLPPSYASQESAYLFPQELPVTRSPSPTNANFFVGEDLYESRSSISSDERAPSPLPANRVSRQDRNSGSDQLPGIQEVSNGTGSKNLKEKTAQQKLKCVIQLKRAKTMPSIEGSLNGLKTSEAVMKIRSNSDASSRLTKDKANSEVRFSPESGNGRSSDQQSRDRSLSLKRRCDSNESGRGSIGTKSRSESFATDTTTQSSGVSSLHSNPSSPPIESSFSSLSTVASSHTVKSIHSSDALRKSHNLSRTPSYLRRLSKPIVIPQTPTSGKVVETSAVFTSSRDAHGYAALKALETQRQGSEDGDKLRRHSSLEEDGVYGSSGKSRSGSVGSIGHYTAFLSPLKSTLKRSNAVTSNEEYIGLCLPVDVSLIFHSDESQYRGGRSSSRTSSQTSGDIPHVQVSGPASDHPSLGSGVASSRSTSSSFKDQSHAVIPAGPLLVDEENERHHPETCIRCTKVRAVSSLDMEKEDCRSRSASECDMLSEYDARPRALSATSGRGTPNSCDTPTSVLGSFEFESGNRRVSMREDTPSGRALVRKEIMRLVNRMASGVGLKSQEDGLLRLKERFPRSFEDPCLYSDVAQILGSRTFRLVARRFIQELFQDVDYEELYQEAQCILGLQQDQAQQDKNS
ncbi:rapamycin-insensitive companion of mTOR-like isoform X2 [Apostichopus japonicus]|uniref:rapamycin-insensitive companion of mTOR-like isoform X2 n=1 Tax=Stichopus japonicus TaxID=307972 RepID=UPI003AB7E666